MTTHNRPWSSKSRTSFKNTERSYSDGNNTRKEILPSISNVNEDSIRERVWAHNFLVNECTMKDIIKRANQIRLDNLQEQGIYKNRPFSRQSNGFQSLITDLSPSPWSQNEYIFKKDIIKPQIKNLAGKRAKSAPAQKIKNNSSKFYECDGINTRLTPKLKSTVIGFNCTQIELKLNISVADSKRNVINTCRNKRPGTCISVMPSANRPLTPFNCTERIDLPNCLIVPKKDKKNVVHNDRSIMAEEKELDSVECDLLRNSTEKPPRDVLCKWAGLDDLEPIIADYSSLKMKKCTQTSKYKKNNQSLIEGLFHVVSRGWTEPDHSSLSSFIMEMEQE
jgi:hypothetical protein